MNALLARACVAVVLATGYHLLDEYNAWADHAARRESHSHFRSNTSPSDNRWRRSSGRASRGGEYRRRGARGTRTIIDNQAVLDWIKKVDGMTDLTLSVCTGALVLGKAGLLDGLAATTYHTAFEELKVVAPNTVQRPDERWVDNGRIVTSAGVSAGIDMALYVVGKLLGAAQADETAHYMEYEHWHGMPVEE